MRDFTSQISRENLHTLQADIVGRVTELLRDPEAHTVDEAQRRKEGINLFLLTIHMLDASYQMARELYHE